MRLPFIRTRRLNMSGFFKPVLFFGVIPLRAAFFLAVSAAALLSASAAQAETATAAELLNSYNLIVLGNLTNNQHVQGKAYVGGNVAGGIYNQKGLDTSLPALTVGGNLTGTVHIDGPGGIAVRGNVNVDNFSQKPSASYVGGSVTGNAHFDGPLNVGGNVTGGASTNSAANLHANLGFSSVESYLPSKDTTDAIAETLTKYSTWLDTLSATIPLSTIVTNGNNATFTAIPNADGIAVFDINNAATLFSAHGEFQFNLGSATEIIINVSGATDTLTIDKNFLGGAAQLLGKNTIWNFTDATDIDFKAQFGGTVLALLADVSNTNNEEGTLVAKSATLNGEVHLGSNENLPEPPPDHPDGPPLSQTPLPGALPLFASGLGAFAWFARRRMKTAA